MKNVFAAIAIVVLLAGCHKGNTQIPSNPSVSNCPAAVPNGTAYTPLNQSAPATVLNYSDNPGVGTWCYVAQSVKGSNTSDPSSTTAPLVFTASNHSVSLTWQAPSSGPTPSGYVISRAPAVVQTLGAPNLQPGTVAENVKPKNGDLAMAAPGGLKAETR